MTGSVGVSALPHGEPPLLLAVDGNSLLHRAYHAFDAGTADPTDPTRWAAGLTDADGRPVWALRGMISFIARAAARLRPDAVVVGFDCPRSSARATEYSAYKAQRPDKPEALSRQLADAPELLVEAGFAVVVPPRYEADDVLASAAALAAATGWRATLVTSDRDVFSVINETTSVLRVVNGGIDGCPLITADELPAVCGVRPAQYLDFAAFRGDASDNLPGAPGIGERTAARLLAAFGGAAEVFAALDSGRFGEVAEAIGNASAAKVADVGARLNVERNQRLMALCPDLVLPPLDTIRLPLDLARMRAALTARGIVLGPSLWALAGGSPPEEELPRPPSRSRRAREPMAGQLALF